MSILFLTDQIQHVFITSAISPEADLFVNKRFEGVCLGNNYRSHALRLDFLAKFGKIFTRLSEELGAASIDDRKKSLI